LPTRSIDDAPGTSVEDRFELREAVRSTRRPATTATSRRVSFGAHPRTLVLRQGNSFPAPLRRTRHDASFDEIDRIRTRGAASRSCIGRSARGLRSWIESSHHTGRRGQSIGRRRESRARVKKKNIDVDTRARDIALDSACDP
jgi:hypothetical protein